MTINEFRNKHCGRGGSPPPPPINNFGGESTTRSKGCSFVRDGSDVTGLNGINANNKFALAA